jgi:hypothetical protein
MALTSNKENSDFPSMVFQTDVDTGMNGDVLTASSGRVYSIKFVNGHGGATYLKMYDDKAPVAGTTDPILVFRADNSTTHFIVSKTGIKFSTACSINASNAGGTSAGSDPGSTCSYNLFGS